jgi:putative PIN family toxin of toxin-antitoxin system
LRRCERNVRVVLDTNIIVSGLMSVTSPPAQILNAVRVGQVVAVMSEATFAELERDVETKGSGALLSKIICPVGSSLRQSYV